MSLQPENGCVSSRDRGSKHGDRARAWRRQARDTLALLDREVGAREDQLDARRLAQSLRRTVDAMDSFEREPRAESDNCAAALIHRRQWIREQLTAGLSQSGVDVIGSTDDGSVGLALTLLEQPALVVLEDRLPWMRAVDIVRTAHEFAPETLVVVQADSVESGEECVEAGAAVAVSRTTPLDEVRTTCLTLLNFDGDETG